MEHEDKWVTITRHTYQEQEQQQHQQKQHGFCDCGRCNEPALDSCSTLDVDPPPPTVGDTPPRLPPPTLPMPAPPTPPPLPPLPFPLPLPLPFPLPLPLLPLLLAPLCWEDAVMPRSRQPLGSSETVQDMPLPAIRQQIGTLIRQVSSSQGYGEDCWGLLGKSQSYTGKNTIGTLKELVIN